MISSHSTSFSAENEGRLTWLVYIIGSAVGGRISFNSNDEHDAMDGELVCRVLQLMRLTDSRLAQVRILSLAATFTLDRNQRIDLSL